MNWKELIIKRKQIKDKSRQKPQTRMSGGIPDISPKGRTDSLDAVFEGEMDDLAEMTRIDIMDMVMERIGSMSKEELIGILERTQGTLGEKV